MSPTPSSCTSMMSMLSCLFRSVVLVVVVAAATQAASSGVPFGHDVLSEHFLLNYTNFNHGSYGACPHSVLDYQSSLRQQQEQQPDIWMRHQYRILLNETRQKVADNVGLVDDDRDGLVIVESASTAVNAILRSYSWQPGDVILYFSVAFGMVKNTALWLQQERGIQIVEAPVVFPISEDQAETAFLDSMQAALQNLQNASNLTKLKMVVLDHIVSNPAVKEPIQELANMIKAHNPDCYILIDGAHAMGQIQQLQLSSMQNIDAYLSNGHKWLYSPKGSAFLWVNTTSSSVINHSTFPEPTVISKENIIGNTSLLQRFEYVSARDYTAFLAMAAAIDFRRDVLGGDNAIYYYCRTLAIQAKHYLMNLWNVTAMAPDSMEEFMINIELPKEIHSTTMGLALHNHLLQQHNIYMPIVHYEPTDRYFTRLSSQVYLEFKDFQRMGDLVLEFVQREKQTDAPRRQESIQEVIVE
ncbi:Cysteine desulfurase [Seminavis robusta]|uniref:Cysteine desulfurase n=1 Tax=Seminavis robusta TaxID=568900 RepID=A0A9N8DF03_9STRA|nr:Cysteine desulfurase [Seminavis robusta]|eukprot:Sro39_g024140.1 Cysteine desulfurase (470) ;mRNA; f:76878-78287